MVGGWWLVVGGCWLLVVGCWVVGLCWGHWELMLGPLRDKGRGEGKGRKDDEEGGEEKARRSTRHPSEAYKRAKNFVKSEVGEEEGGFDHKSNTNSQTHGDGGATSSKKCAQSACMGQRRR